MVSGRRGAQLVSLKGGEPSYRMLVEAMSEGAATLESEPGARLGSCLPSGIISVPKCSLPAALVRVIPDRGHHY
jgi:hypothetical protein